MATTLRLLILEDDPYDAELEVATLEEAGYSCRWERVETRTEFLKRLDAPEDYDLILADYSLPAFDGLTALKLFLERDLDAPFILVSGTLGEEIAIESLKAGATDYVLKDSLSRLGPVVRRALRGKEEQRQRQRAEEALIASEAQYRTLFHNIADPIVIFDRETRRFLDCNQSALDCYGYSREELQTMTPHHLHPPGEWEVVDRNIADQENDSTNYYTHVTKSGEKLQVEIRTAALEYQGREAWISIIRDVTERARSEEERARAEEEIRRRNRELALLNQAAQALSSSLDLEQVLITVLENMRRLLNVVASSVWLSDPETGELVCREATGFKSEIVRGWRLEPGKGVAGWVAQNGESIIVSDARADERHFKGVDRQTGLELRSILSVPLRVKQDVIGVLQVVDTGPDRFAPTDLTLVESLAATAAIAIENARLFATEQQRAAALAETLEQQRELDRLKSEFIQNVSHELRTPLALARGYAELLENGDLGELRPSQQEPMTIIARRVRMLTKLVNNINAIMELETRELEREPVDMVALVHTMVLDFRIAAEQHGLALEAEVAPDLPPVSGDLVHLRRVLDNLLGNALKFTPAGGRITLRLERDGEDAALEVADTGAGIPSDQLERVFERFYQVDGSTSRRYGGTGLGLALVKDIVEAHGGTVSVRSTVGEGSTFRITLPL